MRRVSEKDVQQNQISISYELTTAHIDDWEDISYTTYGIRAVDAEGNTVVIFSDVETNKALVQEIVDNCNIGGLSPLHLKDVIEDTIGI